MKRLISLLTLVVILAGIIVPLTMTSANGKEIILGDITGDGDVSADDLTALARHIAKIDIITDSGKLEAADVNCDGEVDAEDLTKLARFIAKIEDELGPEAPEDPSVLYSRYNKMEDFPYSMLTNGFFYESGVVAFGSYPQRVVHRDGEPNIGGTIFDVDADEPDALAGDPSGWDSYDYYLYGEKSAYMVYKDVLFEGEKYRGVYLNEYRPQDTMYMNNAWNMCKQYGEGFYKEKIYWFKYEPLIWRILEEKDGEMLLFATMIIDSQPFTNLYKSKCEPSTGVTMFYNADVTFDDGSQPYANDYAYSSIRDWLNTTFLNTAFTKQEQTIIIKSDVDNGFGTTNGNAPEYDFGVTKDKVFLLSFREATNEAYGFEPAAEASLTRYGKPTYYARCQGSPQYNGYSGINYWWLRTPSNGGEWGEGQTGSFAMTVEEYARLNVNDDESCVSCFVSRTFNGIMPALRIRTK